MYQIIANPVQFIFHLESEHSDSNHNIVLIEAISIPYVRHTCVVMMCKNDRRPKSTSCTWWGMLLSKYFHIIQFYERRQIKTFHYINISDAFFEDFPHTGKCIFIQFYKLKNVFNNFDFVTQSAIITLVLPVTTETDDPKGLVQPRESWVYDSKCFVTFLFFRKAYFIVLSQKINICLL